jgi:hypothetical protein
MDVKLNYQFIEGVEIYVAYVIIAIFKVETKTVAISDVSHYVITVINYIATELHFLNYVFIVIRFGRCIKNMIHHKSVYFIFMILKSKTS